MLKTLKDKYHGKSIAVLGSAPSVTLFNKKQDITIGVNGAGQLLVPGDLFISMDEVANTRSWFKELPKDIQSILRPHAAIYSSRFYPDKKLRERFIRGYQRLIDLYPDIAFDKQVYRIALPISAKPNAKVIDDLFSEKSLREPVKPHLIFRTIVNNEPISRDQSQVNYGGTSACVALQVAHVTGAKEVHLYGVEFSNPTTGHYSGNRYFYKPKPNETGMTSDGQRKYMDFVISQIILQGTNVFSHGPTNLENSIKLK